MKEDAKYFEGQPHRWQKNSHCWAFPLSVWKSIAAASEVLPEVFFAWPWPVLSVILWQNGYQACWICSKYRPILYKAVYTSLFDDFCNYFTLGTIQKGPPPKIRVFGPPPPFSDFVHLGQTPPKRTSTLAYPLPVDTAIDHPDIPETCTDHKTFVLPHLKGPIKV